jgi:hypothetical protein
MILESLISIGDLLQEVSKNNPTTTTQVGTYTINTFSKVTITTAVKGKTAKVSTTFKLNPRTSDGFDLDGADSYLSKSRKAKVQVGAEL